MKKNDLTRLLQTLSKYFKSIHCCEDMEGRLRFIVLLPLILPMILNSLNFFQRRKTNCLQICTTKENWMVVLYKRLLNYFCIGIRLNVSGVKYVLNDYENLAVLPLYGYWMWDYLKPKKDDIFLDVGAHIGKYALQVAKLVGDNGYVVAIEADSMNYVSLKKNIEYNMARNIFAFNLAAWDCDTTLKLFLSDSSLAHSAKTDFKHGSIEIKARALDNLLQEIGIDRVDWVKINVEGAELETLKGLKNILNKSRPRIIAEIWDNNMKGVVKFLNENEYIMKEIPEGYYENFTYYICLPKR